MISLLRLGAVVLVLVPVLAACGRSTSSGAPTQSTLYAGGLMLRDVSPLLGDADNWWLGPPTFDVRPLNSATRDDAEVRGVTTRFTHLGTAETLILNYDVWTSVSIATRLEDFEATVRGTSLAGPVAGDKALYYNRKLAAGPTPYNNQAYVRVGQTIITIVWSHVDAFASTQTFGKIAVKAAGRLKDSLDGKVHSSPQPAADPLLLAPPGPQLTLLGSTRLPIEVLAQIVGQAAPAALADEFHKNGVTDFVFGDYALNVDTRMEVLTAGVDFTRFPTGGPDFIKAYFGASGLSSTGEAGGYDAAYGQYLYGFGGGTRAILMVCKSSVEGEEAARACEAPMALVVGGWHPLLSG